MWSASWRLARELLLLLGEVFDNFEMIHMRYKRHTASEYAIAGNLLGPYRDSELYLYIELMSRDVWDLYKFAPDWLSGFDKVSEALRDIAVELQIGLLRELYHTTPGLFRI